MYPYSLLITIKVLFEGQRAIGVKYQTRDGDLKEVMAAHEVILSAGTVGSAHLLLLSGIGPRDHLEQVGVPVVADVPVGDFLKDHVYMPLIQFTIDQPLAFLPENVNTLKNSLDYQVSVLLDVHVHS